MRRLIQKLAVQMDFFRLAKLITLWGFCLIPINQNSLLDIFNGTNFLRKQSASQESFTQFIVATKPTSCRFLESNWASFWKVVETPLKPTRKETIKRLHTSLVWNKGLSNLVTWLGNFWRIWKFCVRLMSLFRPTTMQTLSEKDVFVI